MGFTSTIRGARPNKMSSSDGYSLQPERRWYDKGFFLFVFLLQLQKLQILHRHIVFEFGHILSGSTESRPLRARVIVRKS